MMTQKNETALIKKVKDIAKETKSIIHFHQPPGAMSGGYYNDGSDTNRSLFQKMVLIMGDGISSPFLL